MGCVTKGEGYDSLDYIHLRQVYEDNMLSFQFKININHKRHILHKFLLNEPNLTK